MFTTISYLLSESLLNQGLIVVAFGLVGVFLILLLFFVLIIVMQKVSEAIENWISKKEAQKAE
ncbi:MAG: hypothetical protein GXY06_07735 [Clostridiaceae bacterium]|nr:hypothetical protein [Clostridiaceae bacterium]